MFLPFLFLLAATLFANNGSIKETNGVVDYVASSKEGVIVEQESPEAAANERKWELRWGEIFGFNNHSSDIPLSAEQQPQQVLSPYLARPVVPHTIEENEKASGTWFGQRNVLASHGVNFSLTYTSDTVGNPVGGFSPGGCAYADVFVVACLLETEKLFGWHGGYFTISAMELNGQDLSQKNIGNIFPVQETYAVETIHFNELSFEQQFLDDRASIKFGRIIAGNEFGISPLAFLYMNAGINANPEALWLNGRVSSYFNSVWGSRFKIDLPGSTLARVGAYQFTPYSRNGVNWDFYPENGVMLLAQYGWQPEFFKPSPSASEKNEKEKKQASSNSTNALSPTNHSSPKGFVGHYWMGGYYSTATYPQFNSNIPAANAFGLYWHADQTVYKPNPCNDDGLILWSDYVLCPQENISRLPFQVNAGIIYTGLIPGRSKDYTTFGVIYGDFSTNFAGVQQQNGNGFPTYELVYEWGYRIHLTNFAYIQPDLQWIINPGGTGNIPNALVLGVETGVVF